LGSLSSNGQYEYDIQPGQKRKRTTRQQIANEARRREAGNLTDAYANYRPPPYPPKKARDVHIAVIPDVSCCGSPPLFPGYTDR
jgi:dual-specificity kinase